MYKAKYTNLKLGTNFPRIGLLVLKPGQFQVIQDKLVIPTKVSMLPMSTPGTLLPDLSRKLLHATWSVNSKVTTLPESLIID